MRVFVKEEMKMIEVHRDILDHLICDKCKKKIEHSVFYWDVVTGHHEWGNDSVDSIKERHICLYCITPFVTEFISQCKPTAHLEMSREQFCRGETFKTANDIYEETK